MCFCLDLISKTHQTNIEILGFSCFALLLENLFYTLSIFFFRAPVFLLRMEVASFMGFPSQKWDFACGSWAFECLAMVSNMSMLLLAFVLGLKVFLQVGSHCKGTHGFFDMFRRKSSDLRNGFCSGKDAGDVSGPKIKSFGGDNCKFGKVSTVFPLENSKRGDVLFKKRQDLGCCQEERGDFTHCRNGNFSSIFKARESSEEDEEKEEEGFEGHEEDDVLHLKKMILIERERQNAVYLELEKERLAAASAANEAMEMIQRLQNEKNLIEMEARQYRSVAEQKQLYDQEVIRALQWIVSRHELDRSVVEMQLKQSRRRLVKGSVCDEIIKEAEERHDDKYQLKDCETDRLEEVESNLNQSFSFVDDCADQLIDSLDIDSSIM